MAKVFLDKTSELKGFGEVLFVTYSKFDLDVINKIKGLRDARFIPPAKGGPGFRFPVDLVTAKDLRMAFGDDLVLRPAVKRWADEKIQRDQHLSSLNQGEDAELVIVPELTPALFELTEARRWQRADIAFMAHAPSSLNCNQPGLGKTIECIGAVVEGGLLDGPNLVVAPVSSLDTVWYWHLKTYQPHDVIVIPEGPKARMRTMQMVAEYEAQGEPFWLVVNPAMLTLSSAFERCEFHQREKSPKTHELRACEECQEENVHDYPEFSHIDWNSVIIDEFHLCGLGNPNSRTSLGFKRLTAKKRIATSGTPIGGKPIKLFGVLSWLYPGDFTSKYRFADQWLSVSETKTPGGTYKKIEGLRPDKEQAFYKMMSAYMIRRLKTEVAADLPEVQVVDLWVDMHPKQEKQYRAFADEAEVRIDDYNLTAVGILAEYARLKQFAGAEQEVEIRPREDPDHPPEIILTPTFNSPKLPQIKRILAELGITGDEDASGDEQVIIFSESTRMVNMVSRWLNKEGISNEIISGEVTRNRRSALQDAFQAGEVRVLVMNTTAGGVAITLDRANTVILLDETWNPDDQEQAIGRAHRLSRIHQVVAYYIRTTGTIQEIVQKRVLSKSDINTKVVDFRAQGLFDPHSV